jgi:hypothetical protein
MIDILLVIINHDSELVGNNIIFTSNNKVTVLVSDMMTEDTL